MTTRKEFDTMDREEQVDLLVETLRATVNTNGREIIKYLLDRDSGDRKPLANDNFPGAAINTLLDSEDTLLEKPDGFEDFINDISVAAMKIGNLANAIDRAVGKMAFMFD